MKRFRIWILLVALAALAACAPVAQVVADTIERSDGATLAYVFEGEPGGPGIAFDPGSATALGVIVRGEADEFTLLSIPDGATCEVTTTLFDCRLGDVTDTTLIGVTGTNVTANATWRRAGGTTVYLTTLYQSFEEAPDGD